MTHLAILLTAKPVAADNIDDDPDMKELMQWAN
jgi:hypothetical protein